MSKILATHRSLLPSGAASALAKGSVGAQHLMRISSALLGATDSTQAAGAEVRLAGELLLAGWEANPLNGSVAAQTLRLEGSVYALTAPCRKVVSFAAEKWWRPQDASRQEALLHAGDYDALARHLEEASSRAPQNLYWLQQAWTLALADGRLPWFAELLSRHEYQQQPLLRFIEGCLVLAESCGDDSEERVRRGAAHALPLFRDLAAQHPAPGRAEFPPPLYWAAPEEMCAHCLALLGELPAAQRIWAKTLARRPWHTNLALRLHDSALPAAPASAAQLAGNTALLLYSFNKEPDLAATLEAMAPGAALFRKVLVLDNGSSDKTAALLRAWQDKLGPDLFEPILLPVNVGAPAARNWLALHPEAAACEYLLYLDDDALVRSQTMPEPCAWLDHLAAAVSRYPQAVVWGLKIRDHLLPWQAQSVDLHIEPNTPGKGAANEQPAAPFSLTSALTYPFAISGLHSQVADFGQFTYTRPCVSVTGCCHLLRRRDFKEHGGFNLVFSPSQYDDLERDLRLAAAGQHACYHGHFSVRHLKRTGKGVQMSRAQYGNGLANSYKLAGRFTPEDLSRLFAFQNSLLQDDLQRKLGRLDELWSDLAG